MTPPSLQKISRKGFPTLFLVISFVFSAGIVCYGFWFYYSQKDHILFRARNELAAVANLKADEVAAWLRERLADARILADNRYLIRGYIGFITNPQEESVAGIQSRFNGLVEHYRYHEVLLVGGTDEILVNSQIGPKQLSIETQHGIEQALAKKEIIVVDLFQDKASQQILLDVVIPLYRQESGTDIGVGAVVLRVDPKEYLFPLISSWPTASETAEIMLVRKEGDKVLYLNELNHHPGSALKLSIPLAQEDNLSVQAVLREHGTFEGKDYRGVEGLLAARKVPGTDWLILAKMDYKEILSSFQTQGRLIATLVVLSLLIALGTFFVIWQRTKTDYFRSLYHTQLEHQKLRKRYNYLMKYANDIILLADADGCILEANEQALAAYGYTNEELSNQVHLIDLIAPRDHEAFEKRMEEARESGGYVREGINVRKDGSEFPVEVSGRWIDIEGKKFLISIIRDINERKQLYQERILLSESLEASQNEIYLFDSVSLAFRYVNQGGLQNLGYSLEEMRKLNPLDIKPDITPEIFDEIISPLIRKEKTVQIFETTHLRKDGTLYPVEVRLQLIERENDQMFLAVILDITERKKSDKEREALVKSLQEKTEEMESLLYVSSHDLRSPLVNIQGFSRRLDNLIFKLDEVLECSGSLDEVRASALPIIKERIPSALSYIIASVIKMDHLINGLLRISRLGRLVQNSTELDMNKLIQSILMAMEHQIQEAQARVDWGELPPCWGDPIQVNQVFSNLIDNSLKYRDADRPLVIRISGETQGDDVIYVVEDNGIGILEEYQSNIWGLFSRLDPLGKVPGEGLGLTVVKRILQRHHGGITLESAPGRGCRFLVTLPSHQIQNERLNEITRTKRI